MKATTVLIVLLVAVGFPAFVLYNIFYLAPETGVPPIADFAEIERQIRALSRPEYEVGEVLDEGGILRVNVVVRQPASDKITASILATNALYDVQSIVGRELSVTIWSYQGSGRDFDSLEGLILFRALTDQQIFKTADELR